MATNLKNLAVHLEKIAYGAAGVLALFILISPSLFTSNLNFQDLEEGKAAVGGRISEEVKLPPIPDAAGALKAQWAVTVPDSSVPWIAPWTTEVRPAVLQYVKTTEKEKPGHAGGSVTKIIPGRNAEKRSLVLRVEGTRGTVTNGARLVRTKLQKKVLGPEAGDWVDVKTFAAEGAVAYDDSDVASGGTYAYRIVSEAAAPAGQTLESPVVESPELALTKALPYEFTVRIITATPFDPANPNAPAALNGEISFWDYGKGSVVKAPKAQWKEKDTFGSKGEYEVRLIELNKVTVVNTASLKKFVLTTAENARSVALPAEVTPESVAEAAAAQAAAAKQKEEEAAAKAAASAETEEPAEEDAPKVTKKKPEDTKKKPGAAAKKPAKPEATKGGAKKPSAKEKEKSSKKETPSKPKEAPKKATEDDEEKDSDSEKPPIR